MMGGSNSDHMEALVVTGWKPSSRVSVVGVTRSLEILGSKR